MSKILCPAHEDTNPSMEVYADGKAYCYVCGAVRSHEELDLDEDEIKATTKEPEDIQATITSIKALPEVYIRQLRFHADRYGFYVVWPDGSYYKKRLYGGKSRYIGPAGHRASLFTYKMGSDTLVVTEGELNAMSLRRSASLAQVDIASPGSCNELIRHIDQYLIYSKIYVIVDRDEPGVREGLKLGKELLKRGKRVKLVAVEKDINQIHQEGGEEAVQAWVKENLGM